MKTWNIFSVSVAVLFFLVAHQACAGQTKDNAGRLSYEPAVVTLNGKLIRKTFPGPPNYEDVQHGDQPETYWLLELAHPVCVNEDPAGLGSPQNDMQVVQLVIDPSLYKSHAKLIGRQLTAIGTLFGSHTGHHHTPVLLTVSTLAAKK